MRELSVEGKSLVRLFKLLLVGIALCFCTIESRAQLGPGSPIVQSQKADALSVENPSILTELATTSLFKLQVGSDDLFDGSFIGTEGEVPVYRINAGGSAIAAGDGSAIGWSEDSGASPSAYLGTAGNNSNVIGTSQTSTGQLGATAALELFQSERWDSPGGDNMGVGFPSYIRCGL